MPGGAIIAAADESERVEAPTTWKAYMMCVFASFGGIFFGYDSGYINGVKGMNVFITQYTGLQPPGPNASKAEKDAFGLSSSQDSLITSILSAGTFFGALIAGDLADWFGRRTTVIAGCGVFVIGVILQTASHGPNMGLIVAGRLVGPLVLSISLLMFYITHSEVVFCTAAIT